MTLYLKNNFSTPEDFRDHISDFIIPHRGALSVYLSLFKLFFAFERVNIIRVLNCEYQIVII